MAIRTDGGDRLEVLRPAGEGDVFLAIELAEDTSIMLRFRPTQAERLIDELRLVLGPRPSTNHQGGGRG